MKCGDLGVTLSRHSELTVTSNHRWTEVEDSDHVDRAQGHGGAEPSVWKPGH